MPLMKCADCGTEFSNRAKACPKCGAPAPPKRTGIVGWVIAGVFGLFVFKACSPPDNSAKEAAEAAERQRASQTASADLEECKRTSDARKASYATLLDARKFWDARLALGNCAALTNDSVLLAMRASATRLSYLDTAADRKAKPDDRLRAIAALKAEFPPDAVQFVDSEKQLQVRADQIALAERKRVDAAVKAEKRKQGVSLGMSKEDVLASSWGKPRHINTSTYTFGVHEQWVYDGGYLYFEDGILKSIQN